MKIAIGIATYDCRKEQFERACQSLNNQTFPFDQMYIYDNSLCSPDRSDNGKFAGLEYEDDPCYYLTCDDDLIYPPDYIEKMIDAVDKFKCIVTCHGRLLRGVDVPYYTGHKAFSFKNDVTGGIMLDVAGTGVAAFSTEYFSPVGLHTAADKRMSDLVFSLEAAKQKKEITMVQHRAGWIQQQPVTESIKHTERNNNRQTQLANEIWKLKSQPKTN